jgi:hypothetical protein
MEIQTTDTPLSKIGSTKYPFTPKSSSKSQELKV